MYPGRMQWCERNKMKQFVAFRCKMRQISAECLEATESKFASGSASPSATQFGPALRRRQRVRGMGRPAAGGHWGLRRMFLKLGHRAGPTISHSIWSAHADDRPRCRSCRSR